MRPFPYWLLALLVVIVVLLILLAVADVNFSVSG
jgi:hypothetical protein